MKKAIFGLVAILVIVMGVGSFGACEAAEPRAMATVSIPSHLEIYPADYSIGVYSDSACTVPLETFGWGNMADGQYQTIEVWVKAEGNQVVDVRVGTSLPPDVGFVTSSSLVLSPGEKGLLKITLTTSDEVKVIVDDFRIYIKGCKV